MAKSRRNVNQITSLDVPDLLSMRKSFQQATVPRGEAPGRTLILPRTKLITVDDEPPEEDPGRAITLAGRNTDLSNPFEYDPVSPHEFIHSDEYYGDERFEHLHGHREIWPWVYEEMAEIFSGPRHMPKYNTVIEIAGIGSGKSSLSGMVFAYMVYWLHCLRSPASYFNLIADGTIAFVNLAPSATTAKKVVFDKVQKTIAKIPFFKRNDWEPDPRIQSELVFKKKSINIVPGNSSSTFTLGYDFYGGVIDEACFFAQSDRDPCEELYDNLNRRRYSRFKDNGLIMLISSATSEGVFVERFAEEHRDDPTVFFRRQSLYDCDPYYKDKERFHISITRDLLNGEVEVLELDPPVELKPEYEKNQSKSLRDFDAIPSHTMDPFYLKGDWENVLKHINRSRSDPFPDPGLDNDGKPKPVAPSDLITGLPNDFRGADGVEYYVHTDLAKGDVRKGNCAAGFAMAHKEPGEDPGESKIILDLSVRFIAKAGDSIDPKAVRDLIHHLKHIRGFNIMSATYDQWQSEESIIRLKEKGVFSSRIAVGYDHHTMLKNLATTGQLDMYFDSVLLREMKGLEDKITKVEPPINGSKDEADGAAGAIWGAFTMVDEGFRPKHKPRVKRGTFRRKPSSLVQTMTTGLMPRSKGYRYGGAQARYRAP